MLTILLSQSTSSCNLLIPEKIHQEHASYHKHFPTWLAVPDKNMQAAVPTKPNQNLGRSLSGQRPCLDTVCIGIDRKRTGSGRGFGTVTFSSRSTGSPDSFLPFLLVKKILLPPLLVSIQQAYSEGKVRKEVSG